LLKNPQRHEAASERPPDHPAVKILRLDGAGTAPLFSVITPAFNVERYVERYFSSISSQSGFAGRIEIVFVDDGSSDRTVAIAREWAARYPGTIRVFEREHEGVAAARNFGLDQARGAWLSFVDADDYVAKDYFAKVARFLARDSSDVALVSCRQVILDEATGKERAIHPLDYRFGKGERVVDLIDEPDCFQLAINSAFFPAAELRALSVRFDERVKPASSDAKFVGDYLLALGRYRIAFLPRAHYIYRKRADRTSIIDTVWRKKETYDDRLKYYYLALLESYDASTGQAPRFVQYQVLYDLSWYLAQSRDGHDASQLLDAAESEHFEILLNEIFALIDRETIEAFNETLLPPLEKCALLFRFKGAREPPFALLGPRDHRRQLACVTFVDDGAGKATTIVDGDPRHAAFEKTRQRRFNNRPFGHERILWVPLAPGENLALEIDGKPVPLRAPNPVAVKPLRRLILWLARLAPIRRRYEGIWLLMDRDTQADDNAEHLYRWLRDNVPGRRICFVLRRSSRDWKRLKREGFRLLPYGGIRHRLALLNAEWIVSSHADDYVWSMAIDPRYGNPRPPGFAFLQHGVTKDDLSAWLNRVPIDFVAAVARPEANAFLGDAYRLTKREVALTGFARHDRLLRMCADPKLVLIMPTWRIGLTRTSTRSNERLPVPSFRDSAWYRAWQAVLADESLARDIGEAGFRLAFFPHANMKQYLSEFDYAESVLALDHARKPIQEVFAEAALLVTDYSSAAFDTALIGRPVIYYQFDRSEILEEHIYAKGYFDYERDGFGEVVEDGETLATLIRATVADGCRMKPQYTARAEAFFAFRDGENCRRNYEAVLERSRPFKPDRRSGPTAAKRAAE
jgi:glycosyltransferase involved in cell wall biosynthesis